VGQRFTKPPRRALVIKLGHIGDVLVTTPVFTALKEAFPDISITAVVNQGTEAMVAHNPCLDRVLIIRREHTSRWAAARDQWRLIRQLRSSGFDLCLELSGGDRGAVLSLLSGAPLRIGFLPNKAHLRARAFHHLVDRSSTTTHVIKTFLYQVEWLGLNPKDQRMKFHPGEDARAKAQELLSQNGLGEGRYALVHPTSRWMFKAWTPEGVARVMEHLAGKGLALVLSSAPDAEELRFVQKVRQELAPNLPLLDLAGKLDLLVLGALIEKARLFFGVDSAPMHMASARGTPVVVLFGPSGEKMWGPWQVRAEVVTGDCDIRPCGQDGCNHTKISLCLVKLPPERVIAAIDRILAEI
jgi:heptosyltransferase-3